MNKVVKQYGYSYLSDTIRTEWKTIRFVIFECSCILGQPLGLVLSAQLLLLFGLPWVYGGAVCCGAILSLYTLLVLRNDTHLTKNEDEVDLLEEKQILKKSYDSRGNCLRYIKVSYQKLASEEITHELIFRICLSHASDPGKTTSELSFRF